MSYGYYEYYKRSKPRTAKGGIKAQSRYGEFGQNWWAKRWIQVLNSFDIGARLDRGRTYARKGQVLSVSIKNGAATAKVQGSFREPYRISIKVKTLSVADWKSLAKKLFTQPVLAAKLLAGQMPENIEEIFKDNGLSLFPDKSADLRTSCNCPDWSNPCKHIAAVYFLLGEEFDRDPFLIFKLRGASRKDILDMAGFSPMAGAESSDSKLTHKSSPGQITDNLQPEPLSVDPKEFWGKKSQERNYSELAHIPAISAALPKQLGSFPFWKSEENFMFVMEEIYQDASTTGLNVLLGQLQPSSQSK